MAENLTPILRFWDRTSDNSLLGDVAVIDLETGAYPTSRPLGDVHLGMLTPFKYRTADQPLNLTDGSLVVLDTERKPKEHRPRHLASGRLPQGGPGNTIRRRPPFRPVDGRCIDA